MPIPLPARIFTHATRYATPFTTSHGQLCIAVPNGIGGHAIWALSSRRFRHWLAHTFFTEHGVYPTLRALADAICMLEAQAAHSPLPRHLVDRRLTHRGNPHNPDAILLDLANDENQIVEITRDGWTIRESDSFFQRSPDQHPLPTPQRPASGAGFPLDPLLPTVTPAGRVQILAWLLAALRPIGPYPILILKGPPSSAKTTTARLLRALIDPVASPFSPKPEYELGLHRIGWSNRIVAFDHIPRVTRSQAEFLARMATGSGFYIPGAHRRSDRIALHLQRPIVITVPHNAATLRRLESSAFIVDVEPAQRRQESRVLRDFEQLHPLALGALLDATATSLAGFNAIEAASDLIASTIAAAPALALSQTDIATALAPDPLITHLANFLHLTPNWTGSTQELFDALKLPTTPSVLSRKLATLNLELFGIHLERFRTEHARGMRLTARPSRGVSEGHAA